MKLRNKKTGEILDYNPTLERWNGPSKEIKHYISLAELNAEWEDYKESKEWWFIDSAGEVVETTYIIDYDKTNLRKFGNYFETKEEAEKAVEKLKAWKRLKDTGFKFTDWYRDICEVSIQAEIHDDGTMGMINDLDLLFGGEE